MKERIVTAVTVLVFIAALLVAVLVIAKMTGHDATPVIVDQAPITDLGGSTADLGYPVEGP